MLYENVMKSNNTISGVGVCRFCGQHRTVEILQNWSEHEIDEAATELCDCDKAKTYTERKKQTERACAKIEELFGKDNKEVQVSAKTVSLLRDSVLLICEGLAAAVSVDIGNGVKAKIKKGREGAIRVTRTITNTDTREC